MAALLRPRAYPLAVAFVASLPPLAVFAPRGSTVLYIALALLALRLPEVRRRLVALAGSAPALAGIAYLAWFQLSALWAPEPAPGSWLAARTIVMCGVGLVLLALLLSLEKAALRSLAPTVAWSGMGLAALFFVSMALCHWLPNDLAPAFLRSDGVCRPLALWRASPVLAMAAVPLGFVIAWRWGGAAAAVFAALVLAGLADHFKSGPLLSLVAAAAVFPLVRYGGRFAARSVAAAFPIWILAAPLLCGLLVASPAVRALAPELSIGWQLRLHIWDATLRQIADAPLIGRGVGFSKHQSTLQGPEITLYENGKQTRQTLEYRDPHNMFLHVWLEGGAVAAFLLAAATALLWRSILMLGLSPPLLAATAATATTWFANSATDQAPWDTWWVTTAWTVLLVTALVLRLAPLAGADRR